MENDQFKPLNGHNLVVFRAKYYTENGGDRREGVVEVAEQPNHRLLSRRLANFNKF